ncbi:MAG: hypothetical protein RIF39_04270, partial [Cyclobacteriaceae bacterium]
MKYILFLIGIVFIGTTSYGAPAFQSDSTLHTSVTVTSFDVETATQAFIDTLTPEQKEKSDSYFEGGYWLTLWGLIYGLVVAWLFLSKGISSKINAIA